MTPEEIAERTPKGRLKFANLIHWAAGDLKRDGVELLIDRDGVYRVRSGAEVLAAPPPIIGEYLSRFTEHVAGPIDLDADELEAEEAVPLQGSKDERSRDLADMKPTNLILYRRPGTAKPSLLLRKRFGSAMVRCPTVVTTQQSGTATTNWSGRDRCSSSLFTNPTLTKISWKVGRTTGEGEQAASGLQG